MKTNAIQTLAETFEGHAQQTDGGVEFWLARDTGTTWVWGVEELSQGNLKSKKKLVRFLDMWF